MKVKHITQYLFESFKDAQQKFSQEASEEEVKQYLETFKQLTKKGTISGQDKDIGYWIKQGWNLFKEFVDSKSQEKSKSEVKKSKKKDSIIVHDDDDYFMVIPLTKNASCFYGKNTQWCTAATESENEFAYYFYIQNQAFMYIFNKSENEKYAIVYDIDKNDLVGFYNENDKQCTPEEFKNAIDISLQYIKDFFVQNLDIIQKAINVNNLKKETLIDIIEYIPGIIRKIDNPSEDVQLAAVNKNVESIGFIEKPTDKVIETAIRNDPFEAIRSLDEGLFNEQIIWKVLKIEPRTLNFFNRIEGFPTQKMIDYVFQYSPIHALEYYDNITEKQAWHILKHDVDYIHQLHDDSNGQYPNNEMVEYAFKQSPQEGIAYIDNPTEQQQMKAVKDNPYSIRHMKEVYPAVQLETVKQEPSLIRLVPSPTREVIEYIIDLNDDNLISKLFFNPEVSPDKLDEDLIKKIRQVMGYE
ncbi:hypothetical protein PBI_SCTP2_34 [Salicola phage SCTP-2]|nr:hypothetical protein PBI_SCTP2_34 [Salicola phage SCTP-2]